MSVSIDGQNLGCTDVHAIAHGASVELSEGARSAMEENVASMPAGPSILEEKRHWLRSLASQSQLAKPPALHCSLKFKSISPSSAE